MFDVFDRSEEKSYLRVTYLQPLLIQDILVLKFLTHEIPVFVQIIALVTIIISWQLQLVK